MELVRVTIEAAFQDGERRSPETVAQALAEALENNDAEVVRVVRSSGKHVDYPDIDWDADDRGEPVMNRWANKIAPI